MIGQELVSYLRESILDDSALPYLWSDVELLRFLNYAEVQACRRAHLLIDGTTANDSGTAGTASTAGQRALCSVSLVANQATYFLSPKVLQIKRCQLRSMTYPLSGPVSYPELDFYIPGWWGTSGTVGTAGSGGYPQFFMNEPVNTITFVPSPSVNDTAQMVISRLPLIFFGLSTSPEIAAEHHDGLCDWAAHLAFSKPDSETMNVELSKMYESRFISRFGQLPDANSERIRRTLSMKQRMRPRIWGS